MEDDEFRPPARVENESFRPSLSPTGDVFDDKKLDIASALVVGLQSEMEKPEDEPVAEEKSVETPVISEPETEPDDPLRTPPQEEEVKDEVDSNASSSPTVATVEIKNNEDEPEKIPEIPVDEPMEECGDKVNLTTTTDIENEKKERVPKGFDGIIEGIDAEKARRRSSAGNNSWTRKKQKLRSLWKLWSGILVCVIFPITVYVIDIIITVNVLERKAYKEAMSFYHDQSDNENKPLPPTEKFLQGYKYNLTETFLSDMLEASKLHMEREKDELVRLNLTYADMLNKRTRRADDEIVELAEGEDTVIEDNDVAEAADGEVEIVEKAQIPEEIKVSEETVNEKTPATTKKPPATSGKLPGKKPTKKEGEKKVEEGKKIAAKPAGEDDPKPMSEAERKKKEEQQNNENREKEARRKLYIDYRHTLNEAIEYNYGNKTIKEDGTPYHCARLSDFYQSHEKIANERKEGWFEYESKKVAQLQQILFILFTIFGFILCILSIALRADMWFKDEWSSFILGTFVPYIISTCLSALIFVKESGRGGLRCFTCRISNRCEDIDPLTAESYPSSFPWLTLVGLSYILKLIDCVIIGGTTLTFVIEKNNKIHSVVLKCIGWLIVFPWLVATPLFGVLRYSVVSEIYPLVDIKSHETLLTGFFYTGVSLWGVLLIAGPIFCRLRMCDIEENPLEKDDF